MSEVLISGFLWAAKAAELGLECCFFARLLGRKAGAAACAQFAVLGCAVSLPGGSVALHLAGLLLLLFLGGVFRLRAGVGETLLSAVLIVAAVQLCFGIGDSVLMLLAPRLFPLAPAVMGQVLLVGGSLFDLALAAVCCELLSRYGAARRTGRERILPPVFVPLLLIFAVSGAVSYMIYGSTVVLDRMCPPSFAKHTQLLLLQVLGMASLFVLMAAHQRLLEGAALRLRYAALELRERLQWQYVEEAQVRQEKTASLRHDIRSHLAVLSGLLERQELGRAQAYLADLTTAAADLSFPTQTGDPALDVLLEHKAAQARKAGAVLSCTLKVSPDCPVRSVDLCTILSNALDNAIHACGELDAAGEIRVAGCRQGPFWLVEVENPCPAGRTVRPGTGLANIQRAALRYGGAAEITVQEGVFCLRVLLNISQRPEDSSQQTG